MKKKKQSLSPEAAKILDQYRNAGKPGVQTGPDGTPLTPDGEAPVRHPSNPANNPSSMRRSGTRGK